MLIVLYFCIHIYFKQMINLISKYKWVLITLMSLIILGVFNIFNFYHILKPTEILPVYQPASVNNELVDSTIVHKINYHKISDFSLTNQNGETVTQKNYDNKIYVADFFFTTCQSICPIMTKNMKDIQDKLIDDSEVLLLSHTVFPEIDSIEVLKKYAIDNNVIDSKWNLVTGEKKEIYNLARKSYLAAKDNNFGDYDMIHTENFVLIDKKKQIRGFYDGTDKEEINRLINDIKILKKSD
jgi:protein SCO1/2